MLSTPLLTLATLGAVLSTTALAAPSPNPDASDLTRRDIQPIPEGKTWSVSYECDSTNVDASGTTADMDSGCKKIDGGAPEIQMNYDTKSYYQISMHMYVNDDCTEQDYGWWGNLWHHNSRGHRVQSSEGLCMKAVGSVKGDSDDTKWGSYKFTYALVKS